MQRLNWLLSILSFTVLLSCSAEKQLTKSETEKLDHALQRLVSGQKVVAEQYNIITDSDGSKRYGVIIKTSDPEALQKSGIHLNSVFGENATANLTIEDIRKVVGLPFVLSIKNSIKSFPK